MTTEEKAKAYDEALKVLHKYDGANIMFSQSLKEEMFPSLKESDDKVIRKCIGDLIKENTFSNIYGVTKEQCLAWIEKQGEHANFLNKIQVGDKVTRNKDGILVNLSQLNRVAKKDERQGEQKPADKVEPKFHEGDIIIHKELGGDYIHNSHKIIQVDILDKKYRLEGGLVAHFSEQDDYELVEQKTAWSEEDEKMFNSALWHVKNSCGNGGKNSGEFEVYNWLKSIKDRYTWEPSDEQMNALDSTLQYSQVSPNSFEYLNSLFNDLKKLKNNLNI